jgi:antirestriction protein ArdC
MEEIAMPATQSTIRDEVTARIVEALEQHLLPWRRPWRTTTANASQPARHSNIETRKPYQGINQILLDLHALRYGLTSRWWGTFNQWHSLCCRIRKRPEGVEAGHWGCRVVFYKPITKPVLNAEMGDEEDEEEQFFVLKTFTLFCADQAEGAEALQVHDEGQADVQPDFAPAEELMAATEADIRYGGDRAYYNRQSDFIMLPPKATFNPPGAFYETVVHELAHWSEARTGWDDRKQGYALGELVAEIASCYVAAELGIPQGEGLGNHAAYLKSWLEALRNDRNFIFKAAKQASRATDYLMGFVKKSEPAAAGSV